MVELLLSKRYLEKSIVLLKGMKNPQKFGEENYQRRQILNDAIKLLLKNSLNCDLFITGKLLVQNFLYTQSVIFCLNKAQDSIQTQSILLKAEDADKKIEALEIEKTQCFAFIVEMIEDLVWAQKMLSNQIYKKAVPSKSKKKGIMRDVKPKRAEWSDLIPCKRMYYAKPTVKNCDHQKVLSKSALMF